MSTTSFVLVNKMGVKYMAHEIVSRLNTSNHSGRSSISGLSKFRLADGRALNRKDQSTFVLVATGEELSFE